MVGVWKSWTVLQWARGRASWLPVREAKRQAQIDQITRGWKQSRPR